MTNEKDGQEEYSTLQKKLQSFPSIFPGGAVITSTLSTSETTQRQGSKADSASAGVQDSVAISEDAYALMTQDAEGQTNDPSDVQSGSQSQADSATAAGEADESGEAAGGVPSSGAGAASSGTDTQEAIEELEEQIEALEEEIAELKNKKSDDAAQNELSAKQAELAILMAELATLIAESAT